MKSVKLKRHVATERAEFKNKAMEFFNRKHRSLRLEKLLKEQHNSTKKVLRASQEVSCITGKDKKPHAIDESLIMPVEIEMAEALHAKTSYSLLYPVMGHVGRAIGSLGSQCGVSKSCS
jgi:hypothetical protein